MSRAEGWEGARSCEREALLALRAVDEARFLQRENRAVVNYQRAVRHLQRRGRLDPTAEPVPRWLSAQEGVAPRVRDALLADFGQPARFRMEDALSHVPHKRWLAAVYGLLLLLLLVRWYRGRPLRSLISRRALYGSPLAPMIDVSMSCVTGVFQFLPLLLPMLLMRAMQGGDAAAGSGMIMVCNIL